MAETVKLDPKGLEAAASAIYDAAGREPEDGPHHFAASRQFAEAAITAYLTAAALPEGRVADVAAYLRFVSNLDDISGRGTVDGVSIERLAEAADLIERLSRVQGKEGGR